MHCFHAGKNIPQNIAASVDITFGWKPLPQDERKCVSLPSLLAERYIYPHPHWNGEVKLEDMFPFPPPNQYRKLNDILTHLMELNIGSGLTLVHNSDPNNPNDVMITSEQLSSIYLHVLECVLTSDEVSTGMMIQYVLAPPPPPHDDELGKLYATILTPLQAAH
jgi:hypothetical protein